MNLQHSGQTFAEGAAGPMELLIDVPATAATPRGAVIVAHPQPLLGGHARHKVPQLLARALCETGWLVLRPNFRGVGQSAGTHDEGRGETQDLLLLWHALRAQAGVPQRLALVGFSFGAYVQACLAHQIKRLGEPGPSHLCLLGMPAGTVEAGRHYDTPVDLPDALVVHGEHDAQVALPAVLDWARPQHRPITVVPGADHFFTGKLPILRQLVLAHMAV